MSMRARFACLLVGFFAVFTACDDASVVTPLSASWIEWADSVAAGAPFGVRLYGVTAADQRYLRVRIHVANDTLTIEPFSVAPPCRGGCPLGLGLYDTLVWVPAIAAQSPRLITVRAANHWQAPGPPWPLRTFGTLTVSPAVPAQPLMYSVGVGSGFERSLGCFVVTPVELSRVYISADQPPAWAPGFTGFAYGRIDPVLRSVCLDDAYVIQVDSIR